MARLQATRDFFVGFTAWGLARMSKPYLHSMVSIDPKASFESRVGVRSAGSPDKRLLQDLEPELHVFVGCDERHEDAQDVAVEPAGEQD